MQIKQVDILKAAIYNKPVENVAYVREQKETTEEAVKKIEEANKGKHIDEMV